MSELSRRGFFGAIGAKVTNKEIVIRPPYAKESTLFGTECPQCSGMCGTMCEEEIIKFGDDKTPYLDFSSSGCTDCEACLEACEPGVLNDKTIFIEAKVKINATKCMSWENVMCFSCKEPCLDDAIIFEGLFRPEISAEKCTACGFCIGRCPTGAIEIVA